MENENMLGKHYRPNYRTVFIIIILLITIIIIKAFNTPGYEGPKLDQPHVRKSHHPTLQDKKIDNKKNQVIY